MFRTVLPGTIVAITLIAAPTLAAAQDGAPPKRIRSFEIKKGEPCPKAVSKDEVVVCRTLEEPYRIPSSLRDEGAKLQATNQSWVNRAATIDQVGRVAGGLPDTCSVVGTGGQSGCALQANQAYAADKRARASSDGSGSQAR